MSVVLVDILFVFVLMAPILVLISSSCEVLIVLIVAISALLIAIFAEFVVIVFELLAMFPLFVEIDES